MATNTHIVQNNQIWPGFFIIGASPGLLIISNGLCSMAIYAVFFNRLSTRFQLMVAIDTGDFVFHDMLGMIEYHRMLVILTMCGK
jgi:uncharacterized membrane protein